MKEEANDRMQRRILIAPASFKGSLSAQEAAEVMREFLAERLGSGQTTLCVCPIADGGDDTLAVLQGADSAFNSYIHSVTGPLPGMTVQAQYLVNPSQKVAWLEAAQAHGLKLMPPGSALEPLRATSYGVGELMRHVVATHQPETLVVSVGGSASTDGGMGALQALGVQFLDGEGQRIQTPLGGGDLDRVAQVGWPEGINFGWKRLMIATDVVNPLLGAEGAAQVFGPQKGATPVQCRQLDAGLTQISKLMAQALSTQSDREPWGDSPAELPGAGAAGGLAYGLRCLPRSGIVSGSQWIAEQLGLPGLIAGSDIILTGEGCLDMTSLGGKATGHLLAMAGDKPVLLLCGQARDGLTGWGKVSVYPMVPVMADDMPESGRAALSSANEAQAKVIALAMAEPKAALRRLLEQAWPQLTRLISGD